MLRGCSAHACMLNISKYGFIVPGSSAAAGIRRLLLAADMLDNVFATTAVLWLRLLDATCYCRMCRPRHA